MQILLKELSGQKRIINKLSDTVESLVRRSGRSWSPLIGRQREIDSMFVDIQATARERRDELLDRLNEVCLLLLVRGGKKSLCICSRMLYGNSPQSCRTSPAIWDHIVLHFTMQTQVNVPCHNPSQTGRYAICLPRRDGRLS